MLETLYKCPICASESFEKEVEAKDYTVSQEKFQIVKCQNCGFLFTNPRPTEKVIGKYYQSEDYISHSNTKKGIINKIYHIVRNRALKSKLKLINSLGNKGKILDAGCAVGAFLEVCQKDNWQIAGIEPDKSARGIAEKTLDIEIQESIIEASFTEDSFQIITLWHVLEHIHELDASIEKVKKWLAPKGSLLIAVPNANAYERNIFGEFWAAYDVPRHLYHFTPQTFEKLMIKHKLKVTEQFPMFYDSYYISLLSQRYQKGKANYFKAFMQGYKSNKWAKRNAQNYSSLIYRVVKN